MYAEPIVILGASGIGKTYALRQIFDVNYTYGYKAVNTNKIPTAKRGKYQYIPELRGTRSNREAVFAGFIQHLLSPDYITITDVNTTAPFAKRIIEEHTNPRYYVLTATDSEIRDRILSRKPAPNATLTKEEVVDKTLRQRDKDLLLGYPIVTQSSLNEILLSH